MSKADELSAILAAQDWADITKRLVVFAHRRLGRRSLETAKEIAQEAMTRLWDPAYADWDVKKEPSLLLHLGSVVNGIIRNLNVSRRERSERTHAPDVLEDLAEDGERATDGRALDGTIDARLIVDRFLERTANDELVSSILLLMADGVDKPAAQAAALGVPVSAVYNARRRLDAHLGPVRVEFNLEVGDGF